MKFKVLEWLRQVRDEDYERCKEMNPQEKMEHTRQIAKKFSEKYLKQRIVK